VSKNYVFQASFTQEFFVTKQLWPSQNAYLGKIPHKVCGRLKRLHNLRVCRPCAENLELVCVYAGCLQGN
jgi:hypothetical protein